MSSFPACAMSHGRRWYEAAYFFIGPGAASLLLVIVVVSMSILGLLALMSARSDENLMRRSHDFVSAEYETSASAERRLAEMDGIVADCARDAGDDAAFLERIAERLPEGLTMDGRVISWEETFAAGRALSCSVRVSELGSMPRLAWMEHVFTSELGSGDF